MIFTKMSLQVILEKTISAALRNGIATCSLVMLAAQAYNKRPIRESYKVRDKY